MQVPSTAAEVCALAPLLAPSEGIIFRPPIALANWISSISSIKSIKSITSITSITSPTAHIDGLNWIKSSSVHGGRCAPFRANVGTCGRRRRLCAYQAEGAARAGLLTVGVADGLQRKLTCHHRGQLTCRDVVGPGREGKVDRVRSTTDTWRGMGGGGGSNEPRKQQLRVTNLDGVENAAAVDAMRAALTASRLAAIAGNESPGTPYFSRTMSESSDDLFEISITRDDAWDAMRFPEDGYSTSFSVGEMFPFAGLGEVPLVFDKRPVVHGGSARPGVGGDADMEEDMKARLRGEHPESSGPVSPKDRASLAGLSKCFPVIKHSVMDGRIQKSKGGFKNLKRQTSASSFNSDLSYRHTPGSPINGIVEKAPVLTDVESGEKGVMVVGSLRGAGALGVRGRGSGFVTKGRGKNRRSGGLSSGYQEQLPEHFGVSDCMLGLSIFMTMSCLCMAIADVLLEVLRIKGQFDHLKDNNRREFLILNLLSALVAYHSLLGIRQCKFDAAKNALQVAWLVDVALLVGDVAFIVKKKDSDATIAQLELYLFGGLTFINFLIATYLYIRLSARGHKSGGSSDGVQQGASPGAGCAGAIVPVGSRGLRSEGVEARLETPLWVRDRERTIEPVAA